MAHSIAEDAFNYTSSLPFMFKFFFVFNYKFIT